MKSIRDFDQIVATLIARGKRKKVAVVWPADASTRDAVCSAITEGFASAILVGCAEEAKKDKNVERNMSHIELVDAADPDQAAAMAVALVREGKVDILMKGMINTDNLLRAVLNKETGILPTGATLTHITVAQLPAYAKLLIFSDAAVMPYPNSQQRVAQVQSVCAIAHSMGIRRPRIALAHCSEKIDAKHFPFTEDYAAIKQMCAEGKLGECIVDGPLDVKCACNRDALKKKGLTSPLEGYSDALIFPDIEAANVFYKTISLFAEARMAGVVAGLQVPMVLSSRGDTMLSKFFSIALAAV